MLTASIDGLNFNYEIRGSGFPVMLAHGYCASVRMWDRLVPALASRYTVIAYDARGHGFSSAPRGPEHYGLATLIDDLRGLLDHLGIDRAHLIGHSMGGATVQGFAARHPSRVSATLICNIDGGHQPVDEQASREAGELRRRNHELVAERGLGDYARHQLDSRTAPAFVRDDHLERAAYLHRYASQPVNGFFGVGEALPWREGWLADTATELGGPVAIIAGTEDVMHLGAEALHHRVSQSRMVSIEGAPHDSVNARPAAFNQAVVDFLDAVESGADCRGRLRL